MRAVDLIIKKREGNELSAGEIEFLVQGYVSGEIPDYQLSAFLMAVYFQGMSFTETGILTRAMLDSGDVLDLTGISGPFMDKHSTGGVGDKVSLVLAPLAAACGLTLPMMCGRGLGHTGGTIDKLESIPGYRTDLGAQRVREILGEVRFVIMSQTEAMVPADKKMYALRDVTGTVESVPLITASILSKKCACGAEGFVFDVKAGSGAFMKDAHQAEALARSLVNTAAGLEKTAVAVITDMSFPLGRTVGNLLEVYEALDCLRGRGPADMMHITLRLTAYMLVMAGICGDMDEAEALADHKIQDGSALRLFLRNIELQGGDPDTLKERLEDSGYTPVRAKKTPLPAETDGYLVGCDAYKVGLASVLIGAGRARKEDPVLPHVGIELCVRYNEKVKRGDPLLFLYTDGEKGRDEALALLADAVTVAAHAGEKRELVIGEVQQI